MSENTNKKEIIIDLSDSSNAKSFKARNVIHQEALQKVTEFILEFQEANERAFEERKNNSGKKVELSYKHNTITILGTRGSGKTSFLLSIKEAIIHDKKKRFKDLLFLDMIDPTLVEEKGHVFLNVISSICDEVKEVFDNREGNTVEGIQCERKHWKEAINKLAKGLPSIDGIGSSKFGEWQDAEFVMQNELQAIHSARNLAKYFADFVEQSLKLLNKKQFVLFFDDIDVDSSKGYAVLETIRKYFVSDQLISFLSGDLKLYDALVRDKKWNNFGTKLITFECSSEFQNENRRQVNINHYNDIVTDLTSQYLIKIMQPKYRIHLSTLYDYFMDKSITISIDNVDNISLDKENDLKSFLKKMFENYGIKSDLQRNTFIEFLLKQPLRSVVHFLQYFDKKNTPNTDFVSVFLSDLYEKHVDVSSLQNSITYFIPNVLQTLVQEEKLRESYQLIPSTLDNSFNATLFSSSLLFSNHINKQHKFLIFEYFFKIAYLRNFVNKKDDYKYLALLLKTSGILTDNVFRDSCNQLQSSLYGYYDEPKRINEFGLLSLYSLSKSVRKNKADSFYRIDAVFDKFNDENDTKEFKKALGFMPFFIGTSSKRSNTMMFYSIISLFSTIGEICKRYEENSLTEDNFEIVFKELSQVRYYSITDNNERSNKENKIDTTELQEENNLDDDENEENETLNINDEESKLHYVNFFDLLSYWIKDYSVNKISPYLLGKIFTRFYYSLQVIGDDKSLKLGQIFNLQILAFFNAVLIEEAREENINSINFKYDNIVASERVFIDNIKNVTKDSQKIKLKLSKWLLSCPILIMYLNKKSFELINEFVKENHEFDLSEFYEYFEIYSLLNQVFLDGTKVHQDIDDRFENIYQMIAGNLNEDFLKHYNRGAYRRETIAKFFEEFENVVDREDFKGEEKKLIIYCVERYKKDNGQ